MLVCVFVRVHVCVRLRVRVRFWHVWLDGGVVKTNTTEP